MSSITQLNCGMCRQPFESDSSSIMCPACTTRVDMIVAAERESCARIARSLATDRHDLVLHYHTGYCDACEEVARAINALK